MHQLYRKSQNLMLNINILIFIFFMIWAFTPYLNIHFLNTNLLLLVGCWFFTAMTVWLNSQKIIIHKYVIVLFMWFGYILLLRFLNFSQAAWGNYFVYFLFWFPLIAYSFYSRFLSENQKKTILNYALIIILLNLLDNIRLLIEYPRANIELNFNSRYSQFNIGNTNFSAIIMFFSLIILYLFLNNKKGKIPYLVIYSSCIFYLIISSKTTAFLITITFSIILGSIFKLVETKGRKKIVFICFALILALLVFLSLDNILKVAINLINNPYIAIRLEILRSMISYKSLEYSEYEMYFSRINLGKLSFNTFIDNVLIGIGYQKVNLQKGDFSLLYQSGIGHHSTVLDGLARYGLVGLLFNIVIYFTFLKYIFRSIKNNNSTIFLKVLYFAFFIYSILNNSENPEIGLIIFIALPLVSLSLDSRKEEVLV